MLDKNIFTVRDRAAVFKIVYNRPAHIISKRQSQVFFSFLLRKRNGFLRPVNKTELKSLYIAGTQPHPCGKQKMA